MNFQTFDTPIGRLTVTADESGLRSLLPEERPENPNDLTAEAARQITEYFDGKRTTFTLPLCPQGTAFQQAVWQALCAVPFGTAVTYGQLAAAMGKPKAVRAVGGAVGKNPLLILIPCHRVLGKNGALTGFSAGGFRKKILLDREAIPYRSFQRSSHMIRKATKADILSVAEIYTHIHEAEAAGRLCIGWLPGIYPVRATAEAALARKDLFVYEKDDRILAAAVINQKQIDGYEDGDWQFSADANEVMVLHTLTVDPAAAKGGIGRAFVTFYEDYAKQNGCTVLRMDTNEKNAVARKFYAGMGYREAGIVPCDFNGIPNVKMVLLEKKL